jgi:hypothetical protein
MGSGTKTTQLSTVRKSVHIVTISKQYFIALARKKNPELIVGVYAQGTIVVTNISGRYDTSVHRNSRM